MKRFVCCICLLLIILLLVGCAITKTLEAEPEPTTVPTPTPTPSDVEAEPEPMTVPTPTPTPSVFDVDNFEMQATPQSSCFSEIGYDLVGEILVVQFRDSGAVYTYSDFPEGEWSKFVSADSLGRWFNNYIKGNYEYERIS